LQRNGRTGILVRPFCNTDDGAAVTMESYRYSALIEPQVDASVETT
jgi:hypothetical protein